MAVSVGLHSVDQHFGSFVEAVLVVEQQMYHFVSAVLAILKKQILQIVLFYIFKVFHVNHTCGACGGCDWVGGCG